MSNIPKEFSVRMLETPVESLKNWLENLYQKAEIKTVEPIYSAFMFFCTGALLISGNLFFYPLFFVYWGFMTVLMKCTEERWLENLYGREYKEYCRCVNWCIPWRTKRGERC